MGYRCLKRCTTCWLGKIIVEELLKDKKINSVEKVYLMTTNSEEFYKQLGFKINTSQTLMLLS